MATIVLTAVGSLFGPVGAAIGALAGRAIDAEIFKPAGREGPRLSDLRVQTSSFGTQIPRLYGRMRVAGTVIWATDLFENVERSGGGKGKPDVTTYSYSASFAVALSSRPAGRIGRIWADGNLLRGSAGDFKNGLAAFRFHDGSADQPIDPLIAADRGMAQCPAHRGLAYAVFEGLQLADFGNRIPSLTFEIVADEGEISVSTILGSLAEGAMAGFVGEVEPVVGGYAAYGAEVGEALQPLLDGFGLLLRTDGDSVVMAGDGEPLSQLRLEDDLRGARGEVLTGRTVDRMSVEVVPRRLAVRHYDPARDYQAGTQSAERQGAGWGEALVDMPATLGAEQARHCAADLLRRRVLGRKTISLARGWAALALRPGDAVMLDDQAGGWRIDMLEWEGMAVRIGLAGSPVPRAIPPVAADGGSGVRQADRAIGPSHVALVEVPQLFDGPVNESQLFVAASGTSRAWRGAAILLRGEAESLELLGSIRRPAVLGEVLSVLPSGPSRLFDDSAFVDVRLYDADAVLAPASDAALINGANMCLIGEELVQFGHVSQTGPRHFRLSRLLRGRRGTEHWIGGHQAGETMLLLEADTLFPVGSAQAPVGRRIEIAAQGIGDAMPVEAERIVDGRAMLPLSPTGLTTDGNAADGLMLRWVRRSRLGWAWRDGMDAPLGEEFEGYVVDVWVGENSIRTVSVAVPEWTYPAADIAVDLALAGGEPLAVSVRQRGTYGVGAAAQILLPL